MNRLVSTKVIAVANQKGGVGKTTTSVNLSACLARLGQETLLVDMDPQANATSGLGVEKVEGASVYNALLGSELLSDKVLSTKYERLSIIPSEVDLCGAEMELSQMEHHLFRLRMALKPLVDSGKYDLIFLDCPPSLGILTLNSFAAADYLLSPLQCEYYALEGISMVTRILDQLRESGANEQLKLLGILMTMFDGRTNLSHQVVSEVRKHFEEIVFDTVIPRVTRLAEAPSFGKPIIYYDHYSVGAAAYEVLAQEFLTRMRQLEIERKKAGEPEGQSVSSTPLPHSSNGPGSEVSTSATSTNQTEPASTSEAPEVSAPAAQEYDLEATLKSIADQLEPEPEEEIKAPNKKSSQKKKKPR